MMHGTKKLLCLMISFGLTLLPFFTATAQFDGSYAGSYAGTSTTPLGPSPVSGQVAFTVSNYVITVTSPAAGAGNISISGSTNFGGSGGALNATYTFSGTFVVGVSTITASGDWSASFSNGTYNGTGSASGTWTSSHLVTGVGDGQFVNLPLANQLLQNYPNPFNPSTTIRYGLPNRSQVTLTVFNTLGQQVAQLINGEMEAGFHEVKFDGAELSSGVYFYRLQAVMYVETKKFVLTK